MPAQPNIWTLSYKVFFAHGYTKWPVVLGIGVVWVKFAMPMIEDQFNYLNEGHTQRDLWISIKNNVATHRENGTLIELEEAE